MQAYGETEVQGNHWFHGFPRFFAGVIESHGGLQASGSHVVLCHSAHGITPLELVPPAIVVLCPEGCHKVRHRQWWRTSATAGCTPFVPQIISCLGEHLRRQWARANNVSVKGHCMYK